MNIRQELKAMSERVFTGPFNEFIRNYLAERADEDYFAEIEGNYQNAKRALDAIMDEAQVGELARLEAQFQEQQTYAAQYGFYSGLYAGFEQYFRGDSSSENSFHRLIVDGLLRKPGMDRHTAYSQRGEHCVDILTHMTMELGDENGEHITSVEVAWDERVYGAAHISFYFGYRAAIAVQEHIRPLCGGDMAKHILLTEYELGLTLPLSQRELHSA